MGFMMTYNIDGFDLILIGGMPPADGVIIQPDTQQLDNPAYIEAVKKACAIFEDVERIAAWEQNALSLLNRLDLHSVRDLAECRQRGELLKKEAQEVFDLHAATTLDRLNLAIRAGTSHSEHKPKNREGFVYLIQSEGGEYKIGLSKNPKQRIKAFNKSLPFAVEIIHLIKCADMRRTESELHERFADKRVNGEWFALDAADVDYITAIGEA